MPNFIRTATKATGGITADEKARLDDHAKLWIKRAMRTDPIEPDKIIPAVKALYAAAGLKEPRVVIAPSPLVMAFAYGASAAIWHVRKSAATHAATRAATRAATHAATYDATYAATYDATACRDLAGPLGLACAGNWWNSYQGGNMWAGYDCYLTSWRDVIGLQLPEYDRYSAWERCAIHGGFRVLHEEFCIVSDFPEIIRVDAGNRPHCEDGPSHRWRDGWALYHWHGVKVPAHWIEDHANLDPREVIKAANVEQRAAGAAICGWPKMLSVLKAKTIDAHESSEIGSLIELTLPGLDQPGRFLKAYCPRNGLIVEGVPRVSDIDGLPIETAIAAQAWRIGDPSSEFQPSPRRT